MPSFGYKESPPDKMGRGAPTHLLSTAPIPLAASLRHYIVEILDQGPTQTCVAHATTQQVRTTMAIEGVKAPPLPSRRFVYYGACALNNEQNVDNGTYIHSAYETMEMLGFPPESAWPFATYPGAVTQQPDWQALRLAADQRWLDGHYRIVSSGLERIYEVKAALAAQHPVTWGTRVDNAILDLGPSDVWPGVVGSMIGGHAMLIVGYTSDYFEICNSWGTGYADNGFCRVSYAAIASSNASDFWISTVTPEFLEAA